MLDGYARKSEQAPNLISTHGYEQLVQYASDFLELRPDYISSIETSQLRRHSDTDRSYAVMRSFNRHADIQTMQEQTTYSAAILVINKEKFIEAYYGSAEFEDPRQVEENLVALIWILKEKWNL